MRATRRSFLIGLGSAAISAPAIVRAASIMPVRAPKLVMSGILTDIDELERYGTGPIIYGLGQLRELRMWRNAFAEHMVEAAEFYLPHEG